uniref:Uncharacterized protein n=1 Tax=Amphimedon queenslandica TaxID=400682 RepID=A0A1X7UXD0_AMPQE
MSIAKMEAMLELALADVDTKDTIDHLRVQCVPSGYILKPWNSNRPAETYSDKMYVPEVHPITDSEYHIREDDLKRHHCHSQGMTQQTLIALTTTIESREWMRRKSSNGVPAEHPLAGTTDDMDCSFSTLRDTIEPGLFAAGRTTMIKSGEKSIRRQFYQVPVELPPPPETAIVDLTATEHSY